MKKGQVTLFILIGLVILIGLGLIMSNNPKEKPETIDFDIFDTYLETCVTVITKDIIGVYGASAGQVYLTDNFINISGYEIPYLFDVSVKKLLNPTSILEQGINDLVKRTCDYTVFEDQGFIIESENISLNLMMNKNEIVANIDYPVKITKSKQTKEIKNFIVKIPVRLDYIIKSVNNITTSFADDPRNYDISYLESFDFETDIYDISSNDTIFIITDNKSNIDGMPYQFIFGVKV